MCRTTHMQIKPHIRVERGMRPSLPHILVACPRVERKRKVQRGRRFELELGFEFQVLLLL